MRTASVARFYRVLVLGAVSLTGACDSDEIDSGDSAVGSEPDAGVADAGEGSADARAADARTTDCCPTLCRQDVCVCEGEEIPCCWLVPHPLCENICDE